MRSENVTINPKLSGNWHHGAKRTQLVILCHGFRSSSENTTLQAITVQLNGLGHDTFTFDFSENKGGFDVEHQVGDIRAIAEHFIGYDQIILVAASFAALTATIATTNVSAISGLVTLNGFFGTSELGETYSKPFQKFMYASYFLPAYFRIKRYYKRELQPADIKVPVLVIYSEADKEVMASQSKDFYDAVVAPKQAVDLEVANHGISNDTDRARVVTEIDDYLQAGREFRTVGSISA